MFWNNTITLYNRHVNNQGKIKWYRHTISNCFYKHTKKCVVSGNTQGSADEYIVRIPTQQHYVYPNKWNSLTDEAKTEKITIQSGDLIFLGEVSDVIDEYSNGMRSNDLIKKHSSLGCFTIDEIHINTTLPNKHYFIRG